MENATETTNEYENKKPYTIELFNKEDQEEVEKFGLEVSKEMGQVYDTELDYDWGHIKEVYIDPGGTFYVVKIDNCIIGCAGVKNKDGVVAEFKRDRVGKEFRGRGIGRGLFEKRLDFVKSKGFKKIILDTNNPIIEHFCKEFGFHETGRKGNDVFYEKEIVE
ncbi:MAG: GNAT family N-acetyltransferase [Bacteroidetes bacterium]|nr:MAG: GNAT family N-acetyltransferase [Bacteroidota bacterium]